MENIILIIVIAVISQLVRSLRKGTKNPAVRKKVTGKLLSSFSSTERNSAWMKVARELGLSYIRPTGNFSHPAIVGRIGEFDVFVDIVSASDGSTLTTYRVNFPESLNLGILAAKDDPTLINTMFSGRKRFSVKDYFSEQVQFILTADEEKDFGEFLDSVRRNAIINLMGLYPAVTITDNYILLRTRGSEQNAERITTVINHLVKVTHSIYRGADESETPSAQEGESPNFPAPPNEGDYVVTAQKIEEKIPDNSILPEEYSYVAEISPQELPKASEGEKKTYSPLEFKSVIRPTHEEAPLTSNTPAVSSGITEQDALSVEAISAKLFKSTFAGQTEKDYFESIKGMEVRWSGILKTASDYRTDFVFGNTPGVKATFETCEFSSVNAILKSKIRVIASFEPDMLQQFKGQNGKSFTFSGKLEKFEGISKEIYLADANLV